MTEEIRQVFAENIIGSLATINHDGSPWSTPVHVVAGEEAVYWFSSADAQHSENIERDSRVSLSLFSPDLSGGPRAVYLSGRADMLPADATESVRQLFAERAGVMPKAFDQYAAYRLPLGKIDEEKSTGRCWYFYSR